MNKLENKNVCFQIRKTNQYNLIKQLFSNFLKQTLNPVLFSYIIFCSRFEAKYKINEGKSVKLYN